MISAQLVFDGINDVLVPTSMSTPTPEQLIGTPNEQLGELASRICYDSLGYDENGKPRGRSSAKLHQHILEVKNHSVYEHINFTVGIYESGLPSYKIYRNLLNRKGVYIELPDDGSVQITYNPRVILEWERHNNETNSNEFNNTLFLTLYDYASKLIPQILRPTQNLIGGFNCSAIQNLNTNQQWISLYLADSRSWSHEQVRHRFPCEEKFQDNEFWAISQRSTRYVDESESDYVPNPLIEEYLDDPEQSDYNRHMVKQYLNETETVTKKTYNIVNLLLSQYMETKGLDKTAARKQSRGAARDYLCNALATEMIYSAPISGWQWIIANRANPLADSRMQKVYSVVKQILKDSIHGQYFT